MFIAKGGVIKRTTNGGSTWNTVSSGTSNNLYDLFFVNASTGFIAGASGTILKTTNGGQSWFSLTSGTTEWLYSICFKDVTTGYAAGANGTLLKTIDGGTSWKPVTSGLSIQSINDIVYINDRFIAVADAGNIITDLGSTDINKEIYSAPSVSVFPNPASKSFTVKIEGVKKMNSTLNIFDMKGVLVKSVLLNSIQDEIDIERLNNGIYMVEVLMNEVSVKQKLIICK